MAELGVLSRLPLLIGLLALPTRSFSSTPAAPGRLRVAPVTMSARWGLFSPRSPELLSHVLPQSKLRPSSYRSLAFQGPQVLPSFRRDKTAPTLWASSGPVRTRANTFHEFLRVRGGSTAKLFSSSTSNDIVLDPFAERQFEVDGGSTYIPFEKESFVEKINEFYLKSDKRLVDGYAPFCKHIFVPNFTPAGSAAIKITKENEHLLRSDYKARTQKELPVLMRWFPRDQLEKALGDVPKAAYLDIILYSRDQINKEREARGDTSGQDETAPWGIVSIKPTDFDYETPMQPITMMRNALGKDQGGSGVSLENSKYQEAVEFWSNHATVGE